MAQAGEYLITLFKGAELKDGNWEVTEEVPGGIVYLEQSTNNVDDVVSLLERVIGRFRRETVAVEDQLNGNFVVLDSACGRPLAEVALH